MTKMITTVSIHKNPSYHTKPDGYTARVEVTDEDGNTSSTKIADALIREIFEILQQPTKEQAYASACTMDEAFESAISSLPLLANHKVPEPIESSSTVETSSTFESCFVDDSITDQSFDPSADTDPVPYRD